jgi:hypothetical protein
MNSKTNTKKLKIDIWQESGIMEYLIWFGTRMSNNYFISKINLTIKMKIYENFQLYIMPKYKYLGMVINCCNQFPLKDLITKKDFHKLLSSS